MSLRKPNTAVNSAMWPFPVLGIVHECASTALANKRRIVYSSAHAGPVLPRHDPRYGGSGAHCPGHSQPSMRPSRWVSLRSVATNGWREYRKD